MKLENETRKLMKLDSRTPEELAKRTKLGMRWLYRFRKNDQIDYGVRKVQTLHDFLARQ